MAVPTIKTSFASGEWAPKLRGRVDIQKYHAGAQLMRNWFVDYSGGGASTRQGTQYVSRCISPGARLIGFQPSSTVSYVLEFGNFYIRFYQNGAPILNTAVTGGTGASGNTFTIANSFNVGDWVVAKGWNGLTNVNGNTYIVIAGTTGSQVVVADLNLNPVTFTGAYTSGGQLQSVYTIASPYAATDLFPNPSTGNPGIKFVQNVTELIITHPSYQPQVLTIFGPTNWTISAANFGPTIAPPVISSVTTNLASSGTFDYQYVVTSVDANGIESAPSNTGQLLGYDYLGSSNTGTININWSAVSGAVSYNVYKAQLQSNSGSPLTGMLFGFIGNTTFTSFNESYPGIAPDFSQTPPIVQSVFSGGSVVSVSVTVQGTYTAVPGVTFPNAPTGGTTATGFASLGAKSISSISHGTLSGHTTDIASTTNPTGYQVTLQSGVVVTILSVSAAFAPDGWIVNSVSLAHPGSVTSGSVPSNPVQPIACNAPGFIRFISGFGISLTWGVMSVSVNNAGQGYTSGGNLTFSSGSAAATFTVSSISTGGFGNPNVPGFLQERLMLAGPSNDLQGYQLSQPGSFFNFNISNPTQDDDAISGTIISEELNDIRALIPVPTGMIALTGKGAWLINGGGGLSTANPITPSNQTASPQAFNGANDLKPIKNNLDVLYGTNKGNYIRDLTYNIYANIYTGSDISVLSNHLFFNHYLLDWAWSEEPFKTLWAIRDDGTMLSLGYVKEQELIGWAHHDTNGQFSSVCSVIETVGGGNVVDAVYMVVQRQVNGVFLAYVERMADRYFTYGYEDSWSVDCGLQSVPAVTIANQATTLFFSGDASQVGNVVFVADGANPFTSTMATNGWVLRAGGGIYTITTFVNSGEVGLTVVQVPTQINPYTNNPFNISTGYTIWQPFTTFTGLTQLVGSTVIGVADGNVVGPFTVSASGTVTLPAPATKVTLGLAFTPDLQTLPLDLGEPTVQGKRKKITAATLRVADTLGLSIGTKFSTLVPMKDFLLGNLGSQSNQFVTGLVSGDGRTVLDQDWQEAGNYCIRQTLPYPATVLAAMPEVTVGDDGRRTG